MSKNCAKHGQNPLEKPVSIRPQSIHCQTPALQSSQLQCVNQLDSHIVPHLLFTCLYTVFSISYTSVKTYIFPLFHSLYYYNYYIYINRKELTI